MKKSTLMAGLAGAVVMFLLGWIFYGIGGCLDNQYTEAANSIMKPDEEMNIGLIAVANIITGIVMAMLYSKWARGTHSFMHGAQFGALLGVMIGFGIGLIMMATGNYMSTTGHIIDAIWQIIHYGLAGGVIGLVYGKMGDD